MEEVTDPEPICEQNPPDVIDADAGIRDVQVNRQG